MEHTGFSFPNLLLMVTTVAIAAIIFILKKFVVSQSEMGTRSSENKKWNIAIIVYGIWLTVLVSLSGVGFFDVADSIPPRFALFFAALLLVSVVLMKQSIHGNLSFLKVIPPAWLIYIQTFRILAETVIYLLFLEGIVPIQMTFEGRNFDILVGLFAPIAGFLVARNKSYKVGLFFNFFGLAALINIVTIVVLAFPSPFQSYETLGLASYFPGLLIPGFLAPFATYLHILSIKQLLNLKKEHAGNAISVTAA